jgi:hypothetical protein
MRAYEDIGRLVAEVRRLRVVDREAESLRERLKRETDYGLPPEPGTPVPPLSAENLEKVGRLLHPHPQASASMPWAVLPIEIGALYWEVRRLRSDEWLLRAAEEIVIASLEWSELLDESVRREDVLAILRKHRDGQ